MHFISEIRYNPATGNDQKYYRVKESFRTPSGTVRCKIMLNVGFLDSPAAPEDIAAVGRGLMAYWMVNLIRHQLKLKGETCYRTEIVRRMETQRLVVTEAHNALDEKAEIRQCSEPPQRAAGIYRMLGYKDRPFHQKKSVVHSET